MDISSKVSGCGFMNDNDIISDKDNTAKGEGNVIVNTLFKTVKVNGVPVSQTTCPLELICVQTEDGYKLISVFYNNGSQIMLCNKYCHSLATKT